MCGINPTYILKAHNPLLAMATAVWNYYWGTTYFFNLKGIDLYLVA